ncbi:MAG: NAD kinase [Odoribacteraceae bacterium]|jgi:NAD+ kinase|nr:NAD kinase [Odoribacteraceae bacterium]
MKIAIFGWVIQEHFYVYLKQLLQELARREVSVSCYSPLYLYIIKEREEFSSHFHALFDEEAPLETDTDLLISIGGDGTFLDAVCHVKDSGIPVLGINCGRMGFLANVAREEIMQVVALLCDRRFDVEQRALLQLEMENNPFSFGYALNDACALKTETASMLKIHAYIEEEYLTTYWADGLIVATPTGSTAYSLSGGGPILFPTCEDLILTPVSPHNLNQRSLVIPRTERIRLRVESRSSDFMLRLDSRVQRVTSSQELYVSSAGFKLNMVKIPTPGYYEALRNKLGWGEDKRNRE